MPTKGVHLDEAWIEILERFCGEGKEFGSISEYIRSLIREDLRKRGFLKNGVQDDPPEVEVTA